MQFRDVTGLRANKTHPCMPYCFTSSLYKPWLLVAQLIIPDAYYDIYITACEHLGYDVILTFILTLCPDILPVTKTKFI